jgi:hypothetical protein
MNRRGFLAAVAGVLTAPLVGVLKAVQPPANPIYGIDWGTMRSVTIRGYWMRETVRWCSFTPPVEVSQMDFIRTIATARRSIEFTP